MPDAPNAWTDGSLVQDPVSGASSSGSGFHALCQVCIGTNVRGDIWMMSSPMIRWFSPVVSSALFRNPCNLFQGLRSGEADGAADFWPP